MTDTGVTGLFDNLKVSELHDVLASRSRKRMEASEQDDREKSGITHKERRSFPRFISGGTTLSIKYRTWW